MPPFVLRLAKGVFVVLAVGGDEEKNMTQTKDMPITYDFAEAEHRLYRWWEASGWFKPEFAGPDARPFVISIPPPNVTGALHQGHALFVSLQDLMIRHARMKGRAALWVPGTDHAGIATQLQVENALREEGLTREGVGREEFLRRMWAWKEKYGGRIIEQLRRLGASCDWDRERFTLDEGLSRAVREAFVRLYQQGLIYRGTYLINWSPGLQTAVSDLEVEHHEEQVKLYYFKYRLKDSDAYIPVATTRPESILGDTAVAVHPEDLRYAAYVGQTALVPILDREIPVIADDYVDREFGAGALKITPGHDANDYEIGQRHHLAVINILNKDATLNENAGPYAGMDRFEAREKLWRDMGAAGLTLKTEPYTTMVPRSQRGGEIVEPMVSTQWFVRMDSLARAGLEAVADGRIRIIPEHFTRVYENWLTNIRDWCISRQLWWGHRIPAWHCADCGHITVVREDPAACEACGSQTIEQDPDVLDTWFSSGLWPFSTLGWPEGTDDLRRYYPTDVMETGYDILFFWVARMIMMGLAFTDDIPFHTVYLHGLVRVEGKKMSKTAGNVADPIDIIDTYGTDALRFPLLTSSTPGNDMSLSMERIEAGRNFTNKIWNAARLIVTNLGDDKPIGPPLLEGLALPDRWILSRLHRLIDEVDGLFDRFLFAEAGQHIYEFFWSEFADWYIEASKIALYGSDGAAKSRTRHVLVYVLDQCLRMLHPFIPFVTEAVWQHLPHEEEALIIAKWPEADPACIDAEAEAEMGLLMALIQGIRHIQAEYNVKPGTPVPAHIAAASHLETIERHRALLERLAHADPAALQIAAALDAPEHAAAAIAGDVTAYVPLTGLIDLEAERVRLQKQLDDTAAQVARVDELLANEGFVAKAPAEVIAREREKLAGLRAELESLEKRLEVLA
jgi:valyl-tRNA synthetase